jgi:hypothetical protein
VAAVDAGRCARRRLTTTPYGRRRDQLHMAFWTDPATSVPVVSPLALVGKLVGMVGRRRLEAAETPMATEILMDASSTPPWPSNQRRSIKLVAASLD